MSSGADKAGSPRRLERFRGERGRARKVFWVLGLLRPYRARIVLMALAVIAASLTALAPPFLAGQAVDAGILTGDTLPGGVAMTNLVFEDNKLMFKFDSGEYGVIDTQLLVTGTAFAGTINVGGVGEMPIRGAKK